MAEIIDLSAPAGILPKNTRKTCQCSRVVADDYRRMIECRDCGAVVEPFDFIMRIANKNQRNVWASQAAKNQVEDLHKEIEDLKRQKRNLKAQVRRLQNGK